MGVRSVVPHVRGRRLLGLALVASLLSVLVLAAAVGPGAPASAAADTALWVHTPVPAPAAVVAAGTTVVGAQVLAADGVAAARLDVDGASVDAVEITPTDDGAVVQGSVTTSSGDHVAALEVEDEAGRRSTRRWTFTATDRSVVRWAGATRTDTAIAISAATYPQDHGAAAAVLARADAFADALAGAPLAAAVDGPLLLSAPDALPEAVAEELGRVLPDGATVHLLGGPTALSEDVEAAVGALGFEPRRHAGADRFATAAAVAALLPPSSGALLVSGSSFPDALAASVPAARDGWPVLLTTAEDLPDPTAQALADRGTEQATIVGGTQAVGDEVEARVRDLVADVERVAGADRYATSAAVLAHFYPPTVTRLSLASGATFPDALSGTRHAAATGQPLLLIPPWSLASVTSDALRSLSPRHLDVYGGPLAVDPSVADAALRAVIDGLDAPRLTGTLPIVHAVRPFLDTVVVDLDRPVDPVASTVYVEVAGREVPGALESGSDGSTLTFRVAADEPAAALDVAHEARVEVRVVDQDGRVGRGQVGFTYLEPDPWYATTGGVALHLPSREVQVVGFHESNHDGAQQQSPRDTATRKVTLESRSRGTGSRSAADIVAAPNVAVVAPVTGTVKRAGSYVLYCRYDDQFAVIEPDAHPGWEVKLLHIQGLRLRAGDRVEAGRTVVAAGPRVLPFASQVDDVSDERNWPHVHVEVVDPSIPDRGGGGSC